MPTDTEIRCEACGTLNRVPSYSLRRIPRCGKCRESLPERPLLKRLRALYRWRGYVARLALLSLPLLFFAWAGSGNRVSSTSPPADGKQCAGHFQPRPGIYRWYGRDWGEDVAQLTIKTAVGSNYFIRLEDLAGRPARAYFMHGGTSESFPVPLGTFRLKYAAGSAWCDERQLFGNNTVYNVAEDTFKFDEMPGYYPTHWTVELISQPNGNLKTREITRAEFDGIQ